MANTAKCRNIAKTLKRRRVAKPNLVERKPRQKNADGKMDTDISDNDNSANEFDSIRDQVKSSDASKIIIEELRRKSETQSYAGSGSSASTAATHTQMTSSSQQKTSQQKVEMTGANNRGQSSDVPTTDTSTKKVKIPPINVLNQNPGDMVRLIHSHGVTNFYKKSLPGKKHAILMNEIEPYQEVKKCLTETNVKYFTYTLKHLKNQTFVLKGLHQSEGVEDILQCLKRHSRDVLKVMKVTRFTTRRSAANKTVLPIFLVHISASSQSKHLVKIKLVNYQVVQWERLK